MTAAQVQMARAALLIEKQPAGGFSLDQPGKPTKPGAVPASRKQPRVPRSVLEELARKGK